MYIISFFLCSNFLNFLTFSLRHVLRKLLFPNLILVLLHCSSVNAFPFRKEKFLKKFEKKTEDLTHLFSLFFFRRSHLMKRRLLRETCFLCYNIIASGFFICETILLSLSYLLLSTFIFSYNQAKVFSYFGKTIYIVDFTTTQKKKKNLSSIFLRLLQSFFIVHSLEIFHSLNS